MNSNVAPAGNFGRQNPRTAYIKTFAQQGSSGLWSTINYVPSGSSAPVSTLTPVSGYPNLYIPGDLYIDGNVIHASDARLKDNIVNITCEEANKILNLHPCTYTLKGDSSGEKHYGFIAQEVEEVFPDLVYEKPDAQRRGLKAINYLDLIPLLVRKIQLLEEEIQYILDNK